MLGINYPSCQLTSRFEVLKYVGDFLPTPQLLMHQYYSNLDCNNGNDQIILIYSSVISLIGQGGGDTGVLHLKKVI